MIATGQHRPEDVDVPVPPAGSLPPLEDPPGSDGVPGDDAAPGGSTPIDDGGEPLVELAVDDRLQLLNLYRADGWPGTSDRVLLRAGVADRLADAAASLPDGFGLAVFDGWRSPATVRALHDHFYGPGSTLEPGFLADPDDPDVVPPHGTGGAVDVTLTWDGRALALGTCFDDFTPRAHLRSLEVGTDDLDGASRVLRRLLHRHLGAAGFVGLREEWWHVSYGDQRWAAATGAPAAIYGLALP